MTQLTPVRPLCVPHSADSTRFAYYKATTSAEDVVQETLGCAWRDLWDSLREEAAVRGWLLMIARREAARAFERKKVAMVALEYG